MQRIRCNDGVGKFFGHNQVADGLPGAAVPAPTAVGGVGVAFPPKILYMTVPQVGHLPLMAFRPFLVVTSTASTISFLALHLTQ